MLEIQKDVLEKMTSTFLRNSQEAGFLLGCTSRLDCLDRCEQVPAIRAGLHFYEPDSSRANEIIRKWADQGVCFCGFIHSHIVDKAELSEADVEYAKMLFEGYRLPMLWFGLAIVENDKIRYRFYQVTDSVNRRDLSGND